MLKSLWHWLTNAPSTTDETARQSTMISAVGGEPVGGVLLANYQQRAHPTPLPVAKKKTTPPVTPTRPIYGTPPTERLDTSLPYFGLSDLSPSSSPDTSSFDSGSSSSSDSSPSTDFGGGGGFDGGGGGDSF